MAIFKRARTGQRLADVAPGSEVHRISPMSSAMETTQSDPRVGAHGPFNTLNLGGINFLSKYLPNLGVTLVSLSSLSLFLFWLELS